MVGARLRRGIGASWVIGRLLGEPVVRVVVKRAEHLVGAYMVEAKTRRPAALAPVFARRLQHVERANKIRGYEVARPVDGAVDVTFRGKMHHKIGTVGREHRIDLIALAYVRLHKAVGRIRFDRGEAFEICGIGQRIQVHHLEPPVNRKAHHGRADEPGPARYQNCHARAAPGAILRHDSPVATNGVSRTSKSGASASLSETIAGRSSGHSMPILGSLQLTLPSLCGA